jgi:P-type conjugative transfer protein TrbJ
MMIRRSRAAFFAATILSLPVAFSPVFVTPAAAQWVVYDPTNYVQNVLSAARALEQINNQIQSLQNEAQMLINQARNLASLPYSSLQQLQQSVQRTQALPRRRGRQRQGSAVGEGFPLRSWCCSRCQSADH